MTNTEVFTLNNEFYENDRERWNDIIGMKRKIAEHIHIPPNSRVLDILFGPGGFTRAVAQSSKDTQVVAGEILQCDIEEAKQKTTRDGLKARIDLLKMDVTHMAFQNNTFDYVVNFTGWGDFTSFSGEHLIPIVFYEVNRVLKKDGIFALTFIPPIELKDYVSRIDKKIEEFRYLSSHRPKSFDFKFFSSMFNEHGFKVLETKNFRTSKSRILPDEAKEILKGVDFYPSFFPKVKMRPYKEIQERFGDFVEKHGIREYRTKFTLIIGKKNKKRVENFYDRIK